jgi:hypothetical protein
MSHNYKDIINSLSETRLNTYKSLNGSSTVNELDIYCYITIQDLSSHFFLPLQLLELSLRNHIHSNMSVFYKNIEWFNPYTLTAESKRQLSDAKRKKKNGKNLTSDAIVAQLSFGYWVYMLSPEHRNELTFWKSELNKVFIGNSNNKNIKKLFGELVELNELRNRLYHNEPIWKGTKKNPVTSYAQAIHSLSEKYKKVINMLMVISPAKYALLESLGVFQDFEESCDKHLKAYSAKCDACLEKTA